jgi:hypothetical protein
MKDFILQLNSSYGMKQSHLLFGKKGVGLTSL